MSEVTKLITCYTNPKGDHQLNNSLHENPKSYVIFDIRNGSCTCSSSCGILLTCLPCIHGFDV